jgi:hypothetical protein
MASTLVTPARAGVQLSWRAAARRWIPAFAGMTMVIGSLVE